MSFSAALGLPNRKLEAGSLWAGPEGDGPQGGVTQSLVGKFLANRKAFEAYALKGVAPHDSFSPAMEYGSMFHLAIESERGAKKNKVDSGWKTKLLEHCKELQKKYQLDAEKVAHWYQYALAQFPVYLEFWSAIKEDRTVLESEQSFDVPYTLPSGRTVRLRGKRDGLSLIDGMVWLDENKTKSQVDQEKIVRQLRYDLQTMFYLVAMEAQPTCDLPRSGYWRHGGGIVEGGVTRSGGVKAGEYPIAGVRYNVVKRSTHKTAESMLKKLYEDMQDGRGGEWFGRWTVPISAKEVQTFRNDTLDPLLETMCVWYDIIGKGIVTHINALTLGRVINYRHPYGVYNPMDEGGTSEYDFYFENGSTAGLRKLSTLFPELE